MMGKPKTQPIEMKRGKGSRLTRLKSYILSILIAIDVQCNRPTKQHTYMYVNEYSTCVWITKTVHTYICLCLGLVAG